MNNEKITQWFSETTYVDQSTGECITKQQFKRDYVAIKTDKNVKITNSTGFIVYTIIARRTGQLEIPF